MSFEKLPLLWETLPIHFKAKKGNSATVMLFPSAQKSECNYSTSYLLYIDYPALCSYFSGNTNTKEENKNLSLPCTEGTDSLRYR